MYDRDLDDHRCAPDRPTGARVIYTGAEHERVRAHVVVEPPVVVADASEKHAAVGSVDKQDWCVDEGVFDDRRMTVVDEQDFANRTEQLRASSRSGFSEEAPGEHRR